MAKVVAREVVIVDFENKNLVPTGEKALEGLANTGFARIMCKSYYARGNREVIVHSYADDNNVYLSLEEESEEENWSKIIEKFLGGFAGIHWDQLPVYEGGTATRREIMDRDEFVW